MRVTVRLFARLREIAGTGELALEVAPPATIATVWHALVAAHPAIEPYGKAVSVARNLEYARLDTSVAEGDEIAFLPPVSGGAPGQRDRHRRAVTVPIPEEQGDRHRRAVRVPVPVTEASMREP